MDNLIDGTRTRRAVIIKLKELGLIFRAPTKKSNAKLSKNVWLTQEDARLHELYDENRLNDGKKKKNIFFSNLRTTYYFS